MCTDTKGRIAEAVEQMLQTRPVCKITVQRVMEQAQMKRQSFYYHYQDIYSVLEWIGRRSCAPRCSMTAHRPPANGVCRR